MRLEKETLELQAAALELLKESRDLSKRLRFQDRFQAPLSPEVERRVELAIADVEWALNP
jgi:hypothetical protein